MPKTKRENELTTKRKKGTVPPMVIKVSFFKQRFVANFSQCDLTDAGYRIPILSGISEDMDALWR